MGENTEILRKETAWQRMMYWKLAIFKCSGKALQALALSIVASLNGNEWESFSTTQKFVAFVVAGGAMWQVIDAFVSSTMGELQAKKQEQAKQDKLGS